MYNTFLVNNEKAAQTLDFAYHKISVLDPYLFHKKETNEKPREQKFNDLFNHISNPNLKASNLQIIMSTNLYYIGFGFINTTIGQGSLNSSNFMEIIGNYYTNLTQAVKADIVAANWLDFCLDTSYFIRNVDPLANTGLWLLYSAVLQYRGYISTMTNPTQLV